MADPGDAPYKIPGQFVYEGVLYGDYVRKEILENPASVDVRKDDVFVVTYPKTGTTWTQEIMTLILNNGDFESNKKTLLQIRSPFMEFYVKINFIMKSISFLYSYTIGLLIPKSWEKYIPIPPYGVLQLADGLSHIRQMPSPILIKSHLQVKFFPPQALKNNKIVYVARNPKDTCVSFYHFYRSTAQHGFYKGPWAQFLRMFINGQVAFGDYFDHVIGWWNEKDRNNVLYLFYEDMKRDPHDAVRKMAAFVERPISEELVDAIVRHTSVKNMQTNSATNVDVNRAFLDSKISPFIRKGVVGDWENYFTVAQNDEFDRIYERRMKDTDLKFEW